MNLDRTDVFLLISIVLQVYLLREITFGLGFNTLQTASTLTSISATINVAIFFIAIVFALQGMQKAIELYFATPEAKLASAKGVGYALIATSFLFVTLFILSRMYS